MLNIKVTVIIPVYNAKKYLHECMDSVISQTLRDIEIICVNDGSTDSSGDILKEYADKDGRITIIEQDNAGGGAARNKGLEIAQGEYLTFLDSDDVFEKNMLERLYSHATKYNLDVLVCRSDGFDTSNNKKIKMPWTIKEKLLPTKEVFSGKDINKDFFMSFIWWPWDKLYKRDYIKSLNIQFQPLRTTNDFYFVSIAVLMAKRVAYINDVLVHQRQNVKTSLSVTREKSWNCFYLALIEVRKFLIDNSLYERLEQDFVNFCLYFSLWNLETMKGKSHYLLYNILREEWFADFGVIGREENYFYNKALYKKLNYILTTDLYDYLNQKVEVVEQKLNRSLSNEAILKQSVSFRVGRVITWLPRKIRGGLRCFRQHGTIYTLKRLWWHIAHFN